MIDPWWQYRAKPDAADHPLGVVDGDTLDVVLDQGLRTYTRARLRVRQVDTAEIFGVGTDTEEYQRGTAQRAATRDWMQQATTWDGEWPLVVTTVADTTGKYGRWLADLTRRVDDVTLTDHLTHCFPEVTTT